MNVAELLDNLLAQGVTVVLDGGDLLLDGPADAVTEDVVGTIRRHKPVLLDLLRSSASPCGTCGAAIGWRTEAGTVACWGCSRPPANAVKLLLVDLPEPRWVDYAAEVARHREHIVEDIEPGVDPWADAEPWTAATPCCSTCGSCAGWVDLLDGWHCLRCSPPRRTERLLDRREDILRRAVRQHRSDNETETAIAAEPHDGERDSLIEAHKEYSHE